MKTKAKWTRATLLLAVAAIGLAFTAKVSAQVQTTTQESAGEATRAVQVENAEVLAVEGNDLFVKMADGTIRHIANVPASTHVTVDGKQLGVRDLKPGMHLQRTVTTTTTPKVVTTTQTVTGKVWHVNPPNSVILTLENGENQSFNIPKGQKFMVNGQQTDAWGLKKGMMVSATKVVEEPITQVQQEAKLTGRMPPAPAAPAPDTPILVVAAVPMPAPAAAKAEAPAALPKTGSDLPLIGLIGLMLIAGAAGIRVFEKVRG